MKRNFNWMLVVAALLGLSPSVRAQYYYPPPQPYAQTYWQQPYAYPPAMMQQAYYGPYQMPASPMYPPQAAIYYPQVQAPATYYTQQVQAQAPQPSNTQQVQAQAPQPQPMKPARSAQTGPLSNYLQVQVEGPAPILPEAPLPSTPGPVMPPAADGENPEAKASRGDDKVEPIPPPKAGGKNTDAKPADGNGNGDDKAKKPKVNISGDGNWRGDGTGNGSAIFGSHMPDGPQHKGFIASMIRAYVKEFRDTDEDDPDATPPARRGHPEPWSSPPFPGHEYQGYPLIGVPVSSDVYPVMRGIYDSTEGTCIGNWIKDSKIKMYGWVTGGGNFSTAHTSNLPTAYWNAPNQLVLDQALLRFEREADTVQQDHWDWGFRVSNLYGVDYRYMTAGGWWSDQLLRNNRANGYDNPETYLDIYIPKILDGFVLRVGRWVACPDIETQFAPDNYLASHSLLFTFDTYTQTGVMGTVKVNDQWEVQGAITAGTDMAPWYAGAIPTGFLGLRWVSEDNNDATYTCLNNFNNSRFRRFEMDGQQVGHDNFNYLVSTWEHRFNKLVHTKTEAYFMWQLDAVVGGTPSIGAPQPYGGGGGIGANIPGYSINYGILNYTMFATGKRDYITVRNEWWNDPQGERTGFQTSYSSHTIGWSHQFNNLMMFRPEIGYYHSYDQRAFDAGLTRNMVMVGFDFTFRF